MSKRDKIIAAWRTKRNPEATKETVAAILTHYFGERFEEADGTSHQLRVSHPALYQHPHFIGGTLSIPLKGGQSVKAIYLKRIAEAIAIIERADVAGGPQEAENDDDNNDSNGDAA